MAQSSRILQLELLYVPGPRQRQKIALSQDLPVEGRSDRQVSSDVQV